ncbi:hypothetical protein V1512DRAFT_289267 [Lipomyces arxii]|uniref:uncharacterized protein n=1 Tax=Lipomyces arxii TaxID=56418 RepID=UPI0034CFB680
MEYQKLRQICEGIRKELRNATFENIAPSIVALHGIACDADSQSHVAALVALKTFAESKINAFKFSILPPVYLILHVHAYVLSALSRIEAEDEVEAIIKDLDLSLIVAGSNVPLKLRGLINELISELPVPLPLPELSNCKYLCPPGVCKHVSDTYANYIKHTVASLYKPTMSEFEGELASELHPVHLKELALSWPACEHWNSVKYLLAVTSNGYRVVPVEIGSSYVEETWSQDLQTFGSLLCEWLTPASSKRTTYLAQHDLLLQISAFRQDILVPDLVHANLFSSHSGNVTINAWVGPEDTISPLHTDPHENILIQTVGYKYVRLYPPLITQSMYPRGDSSGIDMANTSSVELEKGVFGPLFGDYDIKTEDFISLRSRMLSKRQYRDKFPSFGWDHGYVECIIGPGDGLFIPTGWWHYVKSLSVSFSVSFWF